MIRSGSLLFALIVCVLLKPTPVAILGASLGLKLFDVIAFCLAGLIVMLWARKLEANAVKSPAIIFLAAMVFLELVSYLIGTAFHSSGTEDVIQFTRWILYFPLFFAGAIVGRMDVDQVSKYFHRAVLIFVVFSWVLFFDLFGFKTLVSLFYDLSKSRGMENAASHKGLWRLSSSFSNPNYFGCFAAIALLFYLAGARIYNRITPLGVLVAISLGAFVILSGSRTALVALLIGLSALLFGQALRMARSNPQSFLLLSFSFVLALPFVVIAGYEYLTTKFLRFADVGNMSTSFGARTSMWNDAVEHAFANPVVFLLGQGSTDLFTSVDNNYVAFLSKNGVVGLIAFLALLAAGFLMARRNMRSIHLEIKHLGSCLMFALIVLTIASATSLPFHHTQVAMIFFFLWGLNTAINPLRRPS